MWPKSFGFPPGSSRTGTWIGVAIVVAYVVAMVVLAVR